MGLLKKKDERSETIAVRVPASVKGDLEELRRRADAAGFDLTATISDSLIRLVKQVRIELDETPRAVADSALSADRTANGKAV
ncbi:MAG: hypothetical protein ACLQAT_20870 [Candidatus Binataceae bacterium]